MFQVHVKNAFLMISRKYSLKQFPWYVSQRENEVCKLKVNYNANGSPRVCFDKFSKASMSADFLEMSFKLYFFIPQATLTSHMILAVYVDDIPLTGNDCRHWKDQGVTWYSVAKDMVKLIYFFEIEIDHRK